MHIILIILSVLNFLIGVSNSLDTFSLEFERKTIQNNTTEIVKGTAYYQSPQRVFIEVKEPVNQIMDINGQVMVIYYPVEKAAIRIKAKGPIPMPLVQTILNSMRDDYGLTEMGYILRNHETKGDIIYTYWDPPKKFKKYLGEFTLGTDKGLMVYAEAKDPKGKTVAKNFYKKHIELAGRKFPMETQTEFSNNGENIKENIIYSNLKLNISLPNEVANFKVPGSISIKEVEW